MILVNTRANSLNADFHFVPTVHLQPTRTARPSRPTRPRRAPRRPINQATIVYNAPAPFTASFSSRGPLLAGNGDLLKPDLIAPGQDILAGGGASGQRRPLFDLYSGTSMSSPHVAGLAALLKELHPDWSPMAIKSALMTTGYDVLDGAANTNPVVIFRQGAGHVRPEQRGRSGPGVRLRLQRLARLPVRHAAGVAAATARARRCRYRDPSNLNVASIAIGDLAGAQTVTRRVTNVGAQAATYTRERDRHGWHHRGGLPGVA